MSLTDLMDAIPASAARPEGCHDGLTSRAPAADASCPPSAALRPAPPRWCRFRRRSGYGSSAPVAPGAGSSGPGRKKDPAMHRFRLLVVVATVLAVPG